MPLLMLGGLYLCYEGVEKLHELVVPHAAHEADAGPVAVDAHAFEQEKVAGAIRTDFILSAEIMAITLGAVPDASIASQAAVLAVVGVAITVGVYGLVALIVKADDLGMALARNGSASALGAVSRTVGAGLVRGMPYFLAVLGTIGTAAMIWVGGGIILHGLEEYGLGWPAHLVGDAGEAAARAMPAIGGAVAWLVNALGAAAAGIVAGLAAMLVMTMLIQPVTRRLSGSRA